jgi:hypothetical protein
VTLARACTARHSIFIAVSGRRLLASHDAVEGGEGMALLSGGVTIFGMRPASSEGLGGEGCSGISPQAAIGGGLLQKNNSRFVDDV